VLLGLPVSDYGYACECAGPVLSLSLNAHDFMLTLDPKQYRPDATLNRGTALPLSLMVTTGSNVTVETGAGTQAMGVT